MHDDFLKILQIVFADVILSGDNALVIGMAAAGVSVEYRRRAIFLGMALAAFLRIFFAAVASYLLAIPGILFIGGLLLAWVCWRFYRDLRGHNVEHAIDLASNENSSSPRRQLRKAMVTITVADVSMSIDNVVAVAAIARENTALLIFGLALAIALMVLCATFIVRILTKFPALSYAGLLFLIYLAAAMLFDGWQEVAMLTGFSGVSA